MRIHTIIAAAAIAVALGGCYTYPVYQPMPVARLTPQQSADLANNQQQLSQADRNRYAQADAQAAQQDQSGQPYTYAQPATPYYYTAPYYADPYYYGYPYYSGFYPWYPGLSLSFGFGGRFHGRGFRGGGFHGGGFHGGGFHGGGRH
jgi:hypothetical protein